MNEKGRVLWREYPFPVGTEGGWRIGPLTLRVHRLADEIRVVHELGDDPLAEDQEISCPAEPAEEGIWENPVRYVSRNLGDTLTLRPRTADRNVVTRPEFPLNVLPGQTIGLFVSTPCWVEVLAGGGKQLLADLPTLQLSDTWFGASTKEGTLCYAARTAARLQLARIPFRPHRVVTKVTLKNSSDENLLVERMNLPVIHLGLFADGEGALWTETVHLERKQEGQPTDLTIGKGPPRDAGKVRRVSPERESYQKNLLTRGFATLLPIRGDRYGSDMV
jgi:hypothetical protein